MSIASVRAETQKRMGEVSAGPMQCTFCGAPTAWETLSRLGARCQACFDRFCREHQPAPDVGDRREMGSRAWAHALKARDEAGERLTPYQKWAWRRVLHAHKTLDAARDGQDIEPRAIERALEATGDKPETPWVDRVEVPVFDE